jgi:hypothetical protein
MNESIKFKGEDFSEYSIEMVDGSIEMNWYYRGSISGGTGTEGGITVGIEKISYLLEEIKCKDLGEFMTKIRKYQIGDWQFLKEKMRECSTGSWSWNETD